MTQNQKRLLNYGEVVRLSEDDLHKILDNKVIRGVAHHDLVNMVFFGQIDWQDATKHDLMVVSQGLGPVLKDSMTKDEMLEAVLPLVPEGYLT